MQLKKTATLVALELTTIAAPLAFAADGDGMHAVVSRGSGDQGQRTAWSRIEVDDASEIAEQTEV